MTYNCITDTALGSVLRWGSTTWVAGGGETLTLDVGKRPINVPWKYVKVDTGILIEMDASEKSVVDINGLTVDALTSVGGVTISRFYADEDDLPVVPENNGLLVGLTTTTVGRPGMALSSGGAWHIFTSIV